MAKNSKQLKLFNATAEFLVFSMQEQTNSVEATEFFSVTGTDSKK